MLWQKFLEKDIDSLDNISVYYDKDWNECDKEEKMYWLEDERRHRIRRRKTI